jgi:hypothetical protein
MASSDTTTRRLRFLRDFSAGDREIAEKLARQQEDPQRKFP